jgi:hypothetical protein
MDYGRHKVSDLLHLIRAGHRSVYLAAGIALYKDSPSPHAT